MRFTIVLLLGGLVFGACGDDPEPVLLPRLQGKDWRPAAREIAAMGPEAVPQLVSDLAVNSPRGEGSLQASHVLLEMGDAALPPILEMARSGGARERAVAVSLLGDLGGGVDGTLETIGAATRDRDSQVRWAAIFALHGHGRLGVPYLRERLSDEEMIRNTAAAMLMRLGERDDATMSAVRSILARGDDWGVLWRLEEMGPDGSWAVEDVARLALRSEKNLIHCARALGVIASAGDAGAVALEKRLAEGKKPGRDRLTQFTVAEALIAVDPQNAAARVFLREALAEGSTNAAVSLWVAGIRDRAVERQLVDGASYAASLILSAGERRGRLVEPPVKMIGSLIAQMDDRREPGARAGLGWGSRMDLARLLGKLGEEARPALPVLRHAMTKGHPAVRPHAALAVWRIDDRPRDALAAVRACLARSPLDDESWGRPSPTEAAEVLREMAGEDGEARVVLDDLTENGNRAARLAIWLTREGK
jgi:hypothetical protein